MTPGHRLWLLTRPSVRATPFAPLAAAAVVGSLLVGAVAVDAPMAAQLTRLRGAGLVLAAATVFAFDDPAADVADASPLPRWLRAVARAAVQLAGALPLWLLLQEIATWRAAGSLPVGRLSLEAGATLAAGWAVAAWWRRARGDTDGGVVAGPLLVAVVLVAHRLPPRLSLFPTDPVDPMWARTAWLWIAVLVVALTALATALRDPLTLVGPQRRRLR